MKAWTDGATTEYCFIIEGMPLVREPLAGKVTGNQGEYWALIYCLEYALKLGVRELEVCSDSELMVSQINGDWACNNPKLKVLLDQALFLIGKFWDFGIRWIPREQNLAGQELERKVKNATQK